MTMRRYLLLVMALLSVGVAAWAQAPDVDEVEADLKKHSESIKRIADQLDAGSVPETTLSRMLETLLGYKDGIQKDTDDLKAALDEPNKRLGDLGPPPAEGQPPESADIAKLRKGLTDQVSRLTGLSKQADLSQADIERLIGKIRGLQSARSLSRYTTRGMSPWSSKLWTAAAADVPVVLDGLVEYVANWWRDQKTSGKWVADLALIVAALAGAITMLLLPRWSRWRKTESAFDGKDSPSALDKRRRLAARAISRGLLAAGFLQILFVAILGLFVIDRVLFSAFELGGGGMELTVAQAVVANTLFSSLDFQLRAFVRNVDDSYEVRSDLRFAIFKAFKDAGIEIPFPQRDVHVRQDVESNKDG